MKAYIIEKDGIYTATEDPGADRVVMETDTWSGHAIAAVLNLEVGHWSRQCEQLDFQLRQKLL